MLEMARSLALQIAVFVGLVLIALAVVSRLEETEDRTANIEGETAAEETAMPVLAKLPDFSFINQDNHPFGTKDMRGKVTVINFIFTSCPSTCPLLTKQMRELQLKSGAYRERVRLVSITVDPEHDTTGILRGYGQKYHADFAQWNFLTGDVAAIEKVIVDGFKTSLIKEPSDPKSNGIKTDITFNQITHSESFVIVDPQLQIRGYQKLSSEKEMQGMVRIISSLL